MSDIIIKECICGATYKLRRRKLPYSENDEINCSYCDRIVISWRGGEEYFVEEEKGPTKTKKMEK